MYDAETREAIRREADEIDAAAAIDVWEAALSSTWERRPVWVQGDVAPSNLLVAAGAKAGNGSSTLSAPGVQPASITAARRSPSVVDADHANRATPRR